MTDEDKTTERGFWHERWDEGQTGWHQRDTNQSLLRFGRRMTGPGSARILVPLCGKSLDMMHLASQGHQVIGVEWVDRGARSFFAEQGFTPKEDRFSGGTRLEAGGVTILVADIFDLDSAEVGVFDCAFDRGALIALPPAVRSRYVSHVLGLLKSDARILLLTLAYDQTRVSGPPYSVPRDEVRAHFESECRVDLLEVRHDEDGPPRFQEANVGLLEQSTWLITRRATTSSS